MSDFTDEDVQRGADALVPFWDAATKVRRNMAAAVLAAVLPAYTTRVRADLLRELIEQPVHPLTREWLLSVLERVEGE